MLHQVGAGVLGPVFRALDPVEDRTVAIKVFRLDITPEQASALAQHLTELVARLPDHAGLVKPIAAGTEGALAFLATEYAAADSIDQRLRRKVPTPIEEVVPLLAQIAAALDTSAQLGVWHGALHPRDVLVSTMGTTALTGVGIAQALERVGYRPPFRRPYAAPERVAGRDWDHRADVFALAVLAVELATGRRPLMPEHGFPDLLPNDSDQAEAVRLVLARALDENPHERDQPAGAWVANLEAALGGRRDGRAEPVVAAVEPAPPRSRRRESARSSGSRSVAARSTAPEATPEPVPAKLPEAPILATDQIDIELPWELPEDSPTRPADVVFSEPDGAAAAPIVREAEPSGAEVLQFEAALQDWPVDGGAALDVSAVVTGPELDHLAIVGVSDEDQVEAGGRGASIHLAPVFEQAEHRRNAGLMIAATIVAVTVAVSLYYVLLRTPDRDATPATVSVPAAPAPSAPATASAPSSRAPASAGTTAAPPRAAQRLPARTDARPPRPSGPATPRAAREQIGTGRAAETTAVDSTRLAPFTAGRLLVRSSPADAIVSVDGTPRGRTPVVIRDVPYGAHAVTIALGGYETVGREVTLSQEGPSANLVVELTPLTGGAARTMPPSTVAPSAPSAPSTGTPDTAASTAAGAASLQVVSVPAGARVFLNGRAVGTTPLRVSNLPSATHAVRLLAEGYREWSGNVNLGEGLVTRVSATLEPSGER